MNAADCHVHVIDPKRFSFREVPSYRPLPGETGSQDQLANVLEKNGIARGLVVQPSCYGRDNAALLDALACSDGRLKGIATVDFETTENEFQRLSEHGIVGIRLNLEYEPGVINDPRMPRLMERVRELDWWVEVHAGGTLLVDVLAMLTKAKVKSLVDHWGRPDVSAGPTQESFRALLAFGRNEHAAIKLSAPFRVSKLPPPYPDLDPFAEAILEQFSPGRCIWGSDWPFLGVQPKPLYTDVLKAAVRWIGERDLDEVLHTTPARLFGFA